MTLTYPVVQPDGCALRRFDLAVEPDLAHLDRSIPLTAALVVVWDHGKCLLVFNRFRQAWELPGGMIDSGESARQAAARELLEESGQCAETLDFAGIALVWYAPAVRQEHLAVYRATVGECAPFVANDEMDRSMWWNPDDPLDDVNEIDAALVELCPPKSPQSSSAP